MTNSIRQLDRGMFQSWCRCCCERVFQKYRPRTPRRLLQLIQSGMGISSEICDLSFQQTAVGDR